MNATSEIISTQKLYGGIVLLFVRVSVWVNVRELLQFCNFICLCFPIPTIRQIVSFYPKIIIQFILILKSTFEQAEIFLANDWHRCQTICMICIMNLQFDTDAAFLSIQIILVCNMCIYQTLLLNSIQKKKGSDKIVK